MRIVIDGYNLMFARGLIGKKLAPGALGRLRRRFLNDLAGALDPVDAHQTVVVFDATVAPAGIRGEEAFKGISVVYASGEEGADAKIEWLIAHHATPKTLVVVSSDHRVRQAAQRRRAQSLTCDQFLEALDAQRGRGSNSAGSGSPGGKKINKAPAEPRDAPLAPAEAAFWQETFGEVASDPDFRATLGAPVTDLTDAEIAEIKRQIERES